MARGTQLPESRPGRALEAGELARLAAVVLSASPFPALVLEVPSERIVAAGPRASRLLDPSGAPVVDHLLEDYTSDRPAPGADLLAGGRLNGFEAFRTLRRKHGVDVKVRMWVRNFGHQPPSRLVLVVIVVDQSQPLGVHVAHQQESPSVVGIADANLLIERISIDAEDLFERPVGDILGRSLTDLIAEADAAACLTALREASASECGVTLTAEVRFPDDDITRLPLGCELLILPLQPSPSCAFVFLPMPKGVSGVATSDELSDILARLGRGAEIAQLARGVLSGTTERDVPGLGLLTTRELEIVGRLLDGDRPPAIATRLFLTQSTVRNHLASVFAKLRVNSQQEVLDLFRIARSSGQ